METVRYTDRLAGKDLSAAGDLELAGALLVKSASPIWLNGLRADPQAYLGPMRSGKIILRTIQSEELLAEGIDSQQFPVKYEKDSILSFGERLDELIRLQATYADWLEVSPLVISDLQKVRLNGFDLALQRYLWHLQQVSRQPRSQLTIEIERLPVGRARRIPARAYPYLGAHTEDWEYRKLTSIVPSRILSTLPDDLLNIYENRLAARLIVEIYRYLRDRLQEIRKIEEGFDIELELGTHQRKSRVYQLMGQAVEVGQAQEHARATREVLEDLFQYTLGMFNSLLYKSIPGQARDQVPDEVRATNILVNDRHYRFVNLLWKEYLQYHHSRPKTSLQIQREQQSLCRSFDRFSQLLVCHALKQLGFSETQGKPLEPNSEIRLSSPVGDFGLQFKADGTLLLRHNERTLARLVPLANTLAADPEMAGKRFEHVFRHLASSAQKNTQVATNRAVSPIYTLVLYPSGREELRRLPHAIRQDAVSLGNDRKRQSPYGLLPVSPYIPGSVERVARGLRWVIWAALIREYPPTVLIPVSLEREIVHGRSWLGASNKHGLVRLLREPDIEEASALQDFLRRSRKELHRLGEKAHEQDFRLIEDFEQALESAKTRLRQLRVCPLCGTLAHSGDFHPTEQGHFTCTCRNRDCQEAVWGTRACAVCKQPYPFLSHSLEGINLPEKPDPGWVDDIFGMDVLAVPCPSYERGLAFICPFCGACPNAQSKSACISCREHR